MIYLEKPKDFNIKFEIVSLIGFWKDKILLVKRAEHKPQGGTWSLVAGKVTIEEDIFDTIIREVLEETSIVLDKKKLNHAQKVFVEHDGYQFIFHSFIYNFESEPKIELHLEENTDFQWLSLQETINLGDKLMPDEADCLKLLYNLDNDNSKIKT